MLKSLKETIPNNAVWIPDRDVTSHTGKPILESSNFFIRPPIEIGPVISAETTLNGHGNIARRLAIGVLLILSLLVVLLTPLIICAPALIIFAIYRLNRANRHACSYVGENGFARFTAKGKRLSHPKSMLFCFQNDLAMYASRTEIILNGNYVNTAYCFTWKHDGKKIHEFKGRFNKYKNLQPDHPFSLACAVETAWIYYLQAKIKHQLSLVGYVEFLSEGRFRAIRIGEGFVEFVSKKDEVHRFLESEIKIIRPYSGRIEFIPHSLKRVWLHNKYDFQYSAIANAQLLIVSLKNLTKITIK